MKVYKWKAESNDGAFDDHSKKNFETEQEAYNDMRDAVLEKMKWNTEYEEDLGELEENEYILYDVHFQRNKIVHTSFSGVYTYEVYAEEIQYCLVTSNEDNVESVEVFQTLPEARRAITKAGAELNRNWNTEGTLFISKFGYEGFIIYKNRSCRKLYIMEGKIGHNEGD